MLVKAIVILLASLVLTVVAILMRPSTFRVARSVVIAAPPDRTLAAAPGVDLDYEKPFATSATATVSFEVTPEGTLVTWALNGRVGFAGKAYGLLVDIDARVGTTFERGLSALKTAAEESVRDTWFVA